MLVDGSISPVFASIVNPAVELYVPPLVPVKVTLPTDPLVQNGLPV